MSTKKVLICCMGDGHRVPRAIRFSRLLQQAGYEVAIASGAPASEGYFHVIDPPVARGRLARRIKRHSYFLAFLPNMFGIRDALQTRRFGLTGLVDLLRSKTFDIVLVQDLSMLPIAIKNRGNAKVIFDAREYYPEQEGQSSLFRRFERPIRIQTCKQYLPQADLVIATSQGHADAYTEAFGVHPQIVLSSSKYQDIIPSAISESAIRLVHHGVTNSNRQLWKLIDLMSKLRQEFTLDLFLVANDPQRVKDLKEYAKGDPRIRFNDPVPFDQIAQALNSWDIGLHYLEPQNFNLLQCMPNKLFEFIQARLAIAIGPTPSMAAVVQEYGCGVVSKEFTLESMADALNSLDRSEIVAMKGRADEAARQLTEENEGQKLLRLVAGLVGNASCSRSPREVGAGTSHEEKSNV